MTDLIAIDPGGVHVGWAEFQLDPARCTRAVEKTPEEAKESLARAVSRPGIRAVVIESFRLYPDKAMKQAGSDMPTSRLIGAMEYIVQSAGVRLVMQPAAIKTPTLSVLRHRGITLVSRGNGDHAKDAETHGWHYLVR